MTNSNKKRSTVLPSLPQKLEDTCKNLRLVGLDAKKFIQAMLTSTDPIVARRRASWGTENGWILTKEVLEGFKTLILLDYLWRTMDTDNLFSKCQNEKAKAIVIRENLPSGEPPHGMFHSSKNVTHGFFLKEEEQRRDTLVEMNMPFLHSLVLAKLEHAREIRQKERAKRKVTQKNVDDDEEDLSVEDLEEVAMNPVDDSKGVKFFESTTIMGKSNQRLEEHRMKKLPIMLCSMLAFACNRRHCGLQLQNSIMFLACAVTQKVNDYLHFLGLTLSRNVEVFCYFYFIFTLHIIKITVTLYFISHY
ncbi:hypothetical protein DFH28DRAFT_909895 [Melampsora americana]|nr:hypothetical protein DFH28DRAFT_909895 [Melampsora americana]